MNFEGFSISTSLLPLYYADQQFYYQESLFLVHLTNLIEDEKHTIERRWVFNKTNARSFVGGKGKRSKPRDMLMKPMEDPDSSSLPPSERYSPG